MHGGADTVTVRADKGRPLRKTMSERAPSLRSPRAVSSGHIREEVYNVKLAELLAERGATNCEAERRHGDDMPDVIFEWFGLGAVLEAKYVEAGADSKVTAQVADRLTAGFGTLGVGVLYPAELKTMKGIAAELLGRALLRVQLSAVGRQPGPWHEVSGVDGLVEVLEHARAALIDDDELAKSVHSLGEAVTNLARSFASQPGHLEPLSRLVTAIEATSSVPVTDEEAADATRVGALAVLTALMLQLVLCDRDAHVPKVRRTIPEEQRKTLVEDWRHVIDYDYRAVFTIAYQILDLFGDSDPRLGASLVDAVDRAQGIVARGVFGRHDLVGRIYHTLLTQQKFLATYYTSVPAATLLAALAVNPRKWEGVDWGADPGQFAFRIADPSCGTGTLLAAALGSIRRHYATERRRIGQPVEAHALGQRLIEDNTFGFDILAYAVQVCASTLLLSFPGTAVTRSNLVQLRFGGSNGDLGSLDLLRGSGTQGVLFGAVGDAIGIDGILGQNVMVQCPEVDLVIMNPPFTRTQGGSRLLGSLTPDEWPRARQHLDELASQPEVLGRVVAGLGALFVPLADRMLRPGGRIALVLPKTMLTGAQWDQTRQLLSSKYHVETVICSHEAGHWNFSDSTDLAEVLVIARKLEDYASRDALETTWVQLSKNPDNPIDALGVASALIQMGRPSVTGQPISLGPMGLFDSFGQAFTRPTFRGDQPWRHAVFASGELDLMADALRAGSRLPLPRSLDPVTVPVVELRKIADVGPDRARLHDAFIDAGTVTSYPCLWGHDSDSLTTLKAAPNRWLAPSSHRNAEHAQRYAAELWQGAGPLLIPERLWLITSRVCGVLLDDPALANTMWPIKLHSGTRDDYRLLTLWMNSTLGLLGWVSSAEETRGPWLSIKKNKLLLMPVLDIAALSATSRQALLTCWDAVSGKSLLAIGKCGDDPVRAIIDGAFASALGVPVDGMESTRRIFSAEPRVQAPLPKGRRKPKRLFPETEELTLFGSLEQ